jgi:hypothetical protein
MEGFNEHRTRIGLFSLDACGGGGGGGGSRSPFSLSLSFSTSS